MSYKTYFAGFAIACMATIAHNVCAETHMANDKNGVPGMKVFLNDVRIRHSGDEIVFYPIFQQSGSANIGQLCIDNNRYAWIDYEEPIVTYMPDVLVEVPSDGEPVSSYVQMSNVPLDAKSFSKLKIVGRAPNSPKSTPDNYYGDFEYVFTNIPIPQFKVVAADASKGIFGGVFTDNEIELAIVGTETANGNIYVTFTLTNVGKSNKRVDAKDGYATTAEGDRLTTIVKIPNIIDSGDTVKGILMVDGGAGENIRSVKHNFYVGEKGFNWNPQLILK